jgi:hypothetical protein
VEFPVPGVPEEGELVFFSNFFECELFEEDLLEGDLLADGPELRPESRVVSAFRSQYLASMDWAKVFMDNKSEGFPTCDIWSLMRSGSPR